VTVDAPATESAAASTAAFASREQPGTTSPIPGLSSDQIQWLLSLIETPKDGED